MAWQDGAFTHVDPGCAPKVNILPMELRLSSSQLRRAAVLTEKIETLQGELNQLLGAEGEASPRLSFLGRGRGGRRKMSPAARARIAQAQRARWAKYRKTSGKLATPAPKLGGKRRTFSPAALARISRAQKARWAKFRSQAGAS
jgi:hypothetical protein